MIEGVDKQGPRALAFFIAIAGLISLLVLLQIVRDGRYAAYRAETTTLYVPTGGVLQRMALSFDALLADVYWIRAIQHYGGTKRSEGADKQYDLLYPLLDMTTNLDPRFNMAYRFGAVFLTEAYPNGPGRPDQAIDLLKKGVHHMPEKWQYLQDIGFVYYWWLHDYQQATEWFRRASDVPGSPWWLSSLAAQTLAEGGSREASRLLWSELYESADNDWIRNDALRRLTQLRALDEIDELAAAVRAFEQRTAGLPAAWQDLIRAGLLLAAPVDPAGFPYQLDPNSGTVDLLSDSSLFPLPAEPPPSPLSPPTG